MVVIEIIVNGVTVQVEAQLTIQQVLDRVDVPANYLAVEVNAEVVPREEHDSRRVQPGDAIEVVTLVGGG